MGVVESPGASLFILLAVVAFEAVLVMKIGALGTLVTIPLQVVGGVVLLLVVRMVRHR